MNGPTVEIEGADRGENGGRSTPAGEHSPLGSREEGPPTGLSLLLVDDDRHLLAGLSRCLTAEGYRVTPEPCFRTASSIALRQRFDVLIIDISLPDGDGIDLTEALRRSGVRSPILLHSATAEAAVIVRGLAAGADDYVVKPVPLEVLNARIEALHRRARPLLAEVLRLGNLVLEPGRLTVRRGHVEVELSPAQVGVLTILMRNAGQVLSRAQLSDNLGDGRAKHTSNVIDVHIRALRAKIDEPFGVHSIETVRGLGYRIRRGGR